MTQKEDISVKFSVGLGIFDDHYRYPEIDENAPKGKVIDIRGIQVRAGHNFLILHSRTLNFDIDDSKYFIKISGT